MTSSKLVELREYQPAFCPADWIAESDARYLHGEFGDKVSVEPPSFRTAGKWRLVSNGWVGHILASENLSLSLQPKAPLVSIFGMLEYAYDLKGFELLEGTFGASSIEQIFDRLAVVLAGRVLDRARRGFYRAYISEQDHLPYLRGSLDFAEHLRRPWLVRLPCSFQEHTGDIEDNQILVCTLQRIARSGICSERSLPIVGHAYRTTQLIAGLRPFDPAACAGRVYSRLNQDYEVLHALCRFFLESTGPTHERGDHRALPFLVDMAALFERFVARWLLAHLPEHLRLEPHELVRLSDDGHLRFDIDLVLYDRHTGKALAVLDTKYKVAESPDTADIAQVVAYARAKDCRQAFLVFPAELADFSRASVGDIQVDALVFGLGQDLEEAGRTFLDRLRTAIGSAPRDATSARLGEATSVQ